MDARVNGSTVANWEYTGFPAQCGAAILSNFNIKYRPSEEEHKAIKARMYALRTDVTKLVMSAVKGSALDNLCIYLEAQHGTTKRNVNSGNMITIYEIDVKSLRP